MINLCGTCPLKGNFDMVEIQNLGNLFKIGKYIKCSLSSDIAVWVEKQHKPKSKRSQISKSHLKKKNPWCSRGETFVSASKPVSKVE